MLFIFILGYFLIAFEHQIKLNKTASALVMGVVCWLIYTFNSHDNHLLNETLNSHLGDIAGIVFFLMGAMTIVELMDAHDAFDIISNAIKTTQSRKILWIVTAISFFLSAALDNLTTTIVMISLAFKLIQDIKNRLYFTSMIVIAANAGGAWSPIGDVTTTMLWIGGQISSLAIIKNVFIPSLLSVIIPLLALGWQLQKEQNIQSDLKDKSGVLAPSNSQKAMLYAGMIALLFVPIFKTLTGLPPYMGMLLSLGGIWIFSEIVNSKKDTEDKETLSIHHAIRKIDTPSILFFLGILLAVAALQSAGTLTSLANYLTDKIGNQHLVVIALGLLSAIIDNVPLVAATQGMYPLSQFPMDAPFWHFIAYCTGTGGSILIIGSAAGVAAMGISKIEFFWYLRKISFWTLLGYLVGAMFFLI
jgi:Na+/H+ antiporter NhaD/arsenite permease-like protein